MFAFLFVINLNNVYKLKKSNFNQQEQKSIKQGKQGK